MTAVEDARHRYRFPPSAIGESVLRLEFGVRNGTDPHELSRREVSDQYWHGGVVVRIRRAPAWHHVQMLLSKSTLPNLFDNHPPFQIDGNFGGAAGIAEMLVQSHREVGGGAIAGDDHGHVIELLPALPKEWSRGAVRGLRARGGVTIDIMWSDEKISLAMIRASGDEPLRIAWPVDAPPPTISRLSDKSAVVTTRTGNWLEIAPKGQAGEYRISQAQ